MGNPGENKGLLVAVGVVVCQSFQSLLLLTLADQVTRGLGHEPDQEDLQDGGKALESGRHSPCPCVSDLEGPEGRPGGTAKP